MFDLFGVLVLVVLVVLFAWLARRAWGSKRRILRGDFKKLPGVAN